MALSLPHWTVATKLPETENPELDRELDLRVRAIQENFEGLVAQLQDELRAVQNPIASAIVYAGVSVPQGYLWADGTAVSRDIYSDLFAVIGTTYGVGDGSTTFNLPNYNAGSPDYIIKT